MCEGEKDIEEKSQTIGSMSSPMSIIKRPHISITRCMRKKIKFFVGSACHQNYCLWLEWCIYMERKLKCINIIRLPQCESTNCRSSIPLSLVSCHNEFYGMEYWLVKNTHIQKMKITKMRMFRRMCGHTRSDTINNEIIHDKVRVALVANKMKKLRLRWYELIRRRHMNAPLRRCRKPHFISCYILNWL